MQLNSSNGCPIRCPIGAVVPVDDIREATPVALVYIAHESRFDVYDVMENMTLGSKNFTSISFNEFRRLVGRKNHRIIKTNPVTRSLLMFYWIRESDQKGGE